MMLNQDTVRWNNISSQENFLIGEKLQNMADAINGNSYINYIHATVLNDMAARRMDNHVWVACKHQTCTCLGYKKCGIYY
jgi:hypothetical protein